MNSINKTIFNSMGSPLGVQRAYEIGPLQRCYYKELYGRRWKNSQEYLESRTDAR